MSVIHTLEHWFIFKDNQLLLCEQGSQFSVPTLNEIALIQPALTRKHALRIPNQTFFCAELEDESLLTPGLVFVPLRKAFELLEQDWYGSAVKAFSIQNWDKNHHFCGRCGHVTEPKALLFERTCTVCGLAFYPRISPSIIVLIQKEDEILMARSPHFLPGIYGLIAGFVEAGETLEEAIHREVQEEVNVQVKNLRYFGSQAWPFPDSLMVGFFADYAGGEIIIDQHEIEAAGWYRFDQLPGRSLTKISIARKLIDHFITEKTTDRSSSHQI